MSDWNSESARKLAVQIVQRLRDAGYQSLWAGGCVRDLLLGKTPKDYDVATSATPDDVRGLFGKRRTIAIGAAFGVITVIGNKASGNIEVATFRRDSTYSDGRHPDSVTYSSAEEDAQRRDLTINGLFYDPLAEEVIDYVSGKQDLENGIVRAIGDPERRIDEDKLRMLRAVRFTATYDFSLDETTLKAIQHHASEIAVVSAERIAAEMRRMLVHRQRAAAVRLLRESKLLSEILPESQAVFARIANEDLPASGAREGEAPAEPVRQEPHPPGEFQSAIRFEMSRVDAGAWQRTLDMLDALRSPSFPLALASLIVEICRHAELDAEQVPATVARRIAKRWKLSNDEIRESSWLVEHVGQLENAPDLPWPKLQRILIHPSASELVDMAEAVAKANGADLAATEFCRQRLAWPPERLNPPPLINGDILKAAGIKPGPAFRQLLESTRDAQLEGKISNLASALEFAKSLIERQR